MNSQKYNYLINFLNKHNVSPFLGGVQFLSSTKHDLDDSISNQTIECYLIHIRLYKYILETCEYKDSLQKIIPNLNTLPLFIQNSCLSNWSDDCLNYLNTLPVTEQERYLTLINNKQDFNYLDSSSGQSIWINYLNSLPINSIINILNNSIFIYESLLKEDFVSKKNSLSSNLKYISKNLNINPQQELAWYQWLLVCIKQPNILIDLKSHFWVIKTPVISIDNLLCWFDYCFHVPQGTCESIFLTKNSIIDAGLGYLVTEDEDFEYVHAAHDFISIFTPIHFLKKIRTTYLNEKDLANKFLNVANKKHEQLSKSNFSHIEYDFSIISKALSSSNPIKILLWGNPGAGKTQFSFVCIDEAKKTCVLPPSFDSFHDKETDFGQYQLMEIKSAINLAKSIENPIILIDECESILTSSDHKTILTDFLEQKNIHQIWIANNLKDIHEAYLRRFNIIIHIPDMNYEHREQLAYSLFKDEELSQKIAQTMKTPAEIISAFEWCVQINSFSWKDIIYKTAGYQKALSSSKNQQEVTDIIQIIPPLLDKKLGISNIVGFNYLKKEAANIIDIFEHPSKYKELGAKIPKGILLSGGPGTGKTLFAKSIANEIGVPLLVISSSSLAQIPNKIGSLFIEARKHAPCIVFIDEIDILASNISLNSPSSLERQKLLNRLLIEIDGYESLEGVMIIGATHNLNNLDPSLLRSGRLSRSIYFRDPNTSDRISLFKHYLINTPTESLNYKHLAKSTIGMSCANIAEIIDVAKQNAARENLTQLSQKHLIAASDALFFGSGVDAKTNKQETYTTAIHEAGHAVIANYFNLKVERISIIPNFSYQGITHIQNKEGVVSQSFNETKQHITILLAGIAAEKIILKQFKNGGYSDLSSAHSLIRDAITNLGFGKNQSFFIEGKSLNSDSFIKKIDKEENKIINQQFKQSIKLVKKLKSKIINLANILIIKKQISNKELKKILNP